MAFKQKCYSMQLIINKTYYNLILHVPRYKLIKTERSALSCDSSFKNSEQSINNEVAMLADVVHKNLMSTCKYRTK